MPLVPSLLAPSRERRSRARIVILPAFPRPAVSPLTAPPPLSESELAVMSMSPPSPTAGPRLSKLLDGFASTEVKIELTAGTELSCRSPSIAMWPLALIVTFPAFPCPLVIALSPAPLVIESDPVVISISPPSPTA